MKWMVALGVFALAIVGIWLIPDNWVEMSPDRPGQQASDARQPAIDSSGAVGTSGTHDGAAEGDEFGALRDIETITGANDGMSLIGRRVDLHVDVQEMANDHAFWVGPADNRVLVVLARDNRSGWHRQHGLPASHGIAPVHYGQRATVSGVVRPMPSTQEMYSWDLTKNEYKELADRKVYIRADSVHSEGHGTF